jgi:hypothetical protein
MKKGLCVCSRFPIISVLSISFLATSMPGLSATRTYAVISQSGQSLSSVFDGLNPNPAVEPGRFGHQPPRRAWKGGSLNRLPGLPFFTEGGSCPTGACAGNYTVIQPMPGGCAAYGCEVSDFYTDVNQAECTDGEEDRECGDGSGICCADAFPCTNSRGC